MAFVAIVTTATAADVFERHAAPLVKKLAEDGEGVKSLNIEAASKIKPLAASIGSPCLIVKTDDGSYAKVLVSWGVKRAKGVDKTSRVLLIERFVCYRGDRLDLTSALGKDVMLFQGFGFDLDSGQVVPDGQGADIQFTEDGELIPTDKSKIVIVNGSQLPPADKTAKRDPNDHDGVIGTDFSGTWKLDADGRWLGEMELTVTEAGKATGKFTSAESKNTYDITGQVGSTPHNLKLDVFLANTQLAVDGFLWTKDKSQMAGTVTMTGRKFGFVATRAKSD
jgi:hypothetical protein